MRLLVVDDDAVFREELSDLLGADGHEVTTSPSVLKALEELEQRDYDLVFTDLKMPRRSGLELLKEVRARWPQTLVVMITGFASVETAVDAMKVGAFDYVRKPFQIEQIHQVLALAAKQLEFRPPSSHRSEVKRLLRTWTQGPGARAVLHLSPRAEPSSDGVTSVVANYEEPSAIRDEVRSFVEGHPRSAVILEEADRLLPHHRRSDIYEMLEEISASMRDHGPFVLTFDPAKATGADARHLIACVVSSDTRVTLEALANPMRRAILERAAHGPISFSEAMRAAELDDSPKLAFHLKRLVEDGLLTHDGDRYHVTPRGSEAMRLIAQMDTALPSSPESNAAIPIRGN